MKRLSLVVLVALSLACSGPSANQMDHELAQDVPDTAITSENQETPTLTYGQEATELFYNGEVDTLHARFSDPMLRALPKDQWTAIQAKISTDLGPETKIIKESTSTQLNNHMYRRHVNFQNAPGMELVVTWAFLADGTISGFTIAPPGVAAETPHLDYKTKSVLLPPIDQEWTVVWGGRTVEENYHAANVGQRFALDLVITGEDGRSHTGDGTRNEDYFAFGKPVLSPGAGKVLAIENSVEDNVPGTMNPAQLTGNFVFIDHENGEYSLLAHFKKGTIKVSVGDTVQPGQLLGECGNSGNSSEAHIHYHLQNSSVPLEGEGLPIFFSSAKIDDQTLEFQEIRQGQKVAPPQ